MWGGVDTLFQIGIFFGGVRNSLGGPTRLRFGIDWGEESLINGGRKEGVKMFSL